jgi:uncharacterized protein YaiL (DUF2058 family)
MAKLNALQEQLLKAGLTNKSRVAAVAREQAKAPSGPSEAQRGAERAREEKVERDRALAAERNAQAHAHDLRAQARQIITERKLPRKGEREYRFTAHGAIHTLLVDDDQARKLALGALVIAALNDRYELLPRAVGDQVRQRDAEMIVVDHGQTTGIAVNSRVDDDAHYARFEVPDDLVW